MITTRTRAVVAVILTYMLFAILLNSVGTVILQSIASLDQTKSSAAILEAFKDLPIAITSFLVASFLPRFGLKNSLGVACFLVGAACVAMPPLPYFAMTKLLFAITGSPDRFPQTKRRRSCADLSRCGRNHPGPLAIIQLDQQHQRRRDRGADADQFGILQMVG